MSAIPCRDYRDFIELKIKAHPLKGKGVKTKWAQHLGVNSSFISQVLKGQKELSPEQGVQTAEFFSLGEHEKEYLTYLVLWDRATNPDYKSILEKQLFKIEEQYKKLDWRTQPEVKMPLEQQAIFYSDWVYSAIRQSVAIPNINTPQALAEKLQLPLVKINDVLVFLLQTGLVEERNGKLFIGPARTHIDSTSPWIKNHHSNWRIQAIEHVMSSNPNKLHFSAPLTISKKDIPTVREFCTELIEKTSNVVKESKSEVFYCMNIDWFEV